MLPKKANLSEVVTADYYVKHYRDFLPQYISLTEDLHRIQWIRIVQESVSSYPGVTKNDTSVIGS